MSQAGNATQCCSRLTRSLTLRKTHTDCLLHRYRTRDCLPSLHRIIRAQCGSSGCVYGNVYAVRTRAVAQRRAARELEEPESSSFSSPLLCPFEKVPGPIPCPAPLQRLLPPAVSPTCTALSQSPPDNATDGAAGFMGDIKRAGK